MALCAAIAATMCHVSAAAREGISARGTGRESTANMIGELAPSQILRVDRERLFGSERLADCKRLAGPRALSQGGGEPNATTSSFSARGISPGRAAVSSGGDLVVT